MSTPQPAQDAIRIEAQNVLLKASFADKGHAVESAITLLIESGAVAPEYLDDVRAREAVTSSYIGNHIAIPHGLDVTRSHINRSAVSVVQVPDGVPFGDEVAYLIVGIAGRNDDHVQLLSQLAEVLIDPENVEALRTASSTDTVISILEKEHS